MCVRVGTCVRCRVMVPVVVRSGDYHDGIGISFCCKSRPMYNFMSIRYVGCVGISYFCPFVGEGVAYRSKYFVSFKRGVETVYVRGASYWGGDVCVCYIVDLYEVSKQYWWYGVLRGYRGVIFGSGVFVALVEPYDFGFEELYGRC